MTKTLDTRVTRLEKANPAGDLSRLTDAELDARIHELADAVLSSGCEIDSELARLGRATAAQYNIEVPPESDGEGAFRTLRTALADRLAGEGQ